MRRQKNLGSIVHQVLESGNSSTNARVIADILGVVHGDVEVSAHEHALALHARTESDEYGPIAQVQGTQ